MIRVTTRIIHVMIIRVAPFDALSVLALARQEVKGLCHSTDIARPTRTLADSTALSESYGIEPTDPLPFKKATLLTI